ncbi:tripartite ATP-independent transporter DctP family solute receptor [Hydrogenispora ethanolica]|uniref:Tripartite ATP-independent transporter DctP family solute receptor n=1 Tax=Hydrogenispora ethanolica TaxID=1082276 RepID=A0A4R1RAJ5_HYDET|nr:C4-dicarboxylate TRAP transporter substrate-binding protein [Hydrogenispora ethanolica]TCL62736.1 tripartite ATP-independent transporter DctP family solute receptor [Hydrogenispora ethanolica]
MKNFRRMGLMALAAVFVFTAAFSSFAAPKKYVLKFNHVLAESEPFHQGFLNWAKRVNQRTKGGLEIQVFHSAQLGVEEDIIEQLKMGANVGQNTDSARLGMYVPEIAVMNAPYFVDSIEAVMKLNNLPSIKKWEKELADKHGIKILSFNWVQGLRHMVTNKPIRTPGDLKGLRIRTPGAPIWQESIRSLGAAPVAMPFGEVYVGMQQGAVDGADLVYRNVTGAKLYEAAKYMSETKHILLINFEVVGKRFFDSLPASYQKILVQECSKAGLETSRVMEKEVVEIKKDLAKRGMTIVEDVDVAAFKKAGEAAYKALNLTKVRDQVYKEMGKKN